MVELAGADTRTAPKFSFVSIFRDPCLCITGVISVTKNRVGLRRFLPPCFVSVHKGPASIHLPVASSNHQSFVVVFPLLSTEMLSFSGSKNIFMDFDVDSFFPLSSSKLRVIIP